MWSVTLLSAIMVLFLATDINLNMDNIVVLIPIIPFMFLDAFYLGLERHFVLEYNKEFQSDEKEKISVITKSKGWERIKSTFTALASFSVWGFYIILSLTIIVVMFIIDCKQ